jgi:PAS domain S-box-containing protein
MTAPLPSSAKRTAAGTVRLHHLNIGPRLALCFLLIILAMSAGSAVLIWQFQQAQTQSERLTGLDQELIAVQQAHISFMSFYERLDVLAQTENTTILLQQIETIHNALLQETERARNALGRLTTEVSIDPTLLSTLSAIQGELPAQLHSMEMLARSGDWKAVHLRLANQIGPLESRSAELVENVDREVSEQRAQAVLNIRQAQRRIFSIVPTTVAITLLFAALLGTTITRSITRPLGRLMEASTALASGDFSHRVPVTGDDEITQLGNVFNDMVGKLQSDIEERKQAEEALAASERKLEAIINTIPGMAWSANPDGYTDFLNDRWLEYTGKTAEQLQGKGWMAVIHPDDLKRVTDYGESNLASGKTAEVEARIHRYDGDYRWFLFRTIPLLDRSGNIVKWFGTNTDIEDQKRAQEVLATSERDLRSIINTIPTTAWSTRPDGYCDFLNERWLEYTGMAAELAQGWGWGAAIHSDDLKGLVEHWKWCLASGTPIEAETRIRRHDGAYRWFLLRGNPLRDASGRIVKWYGINIDIEDRKSAEEALNIARSELAHVARMTTLNALTASIAHEVNQPLAGIVTNASTCLRMLDGDSPNVEGARETARRTIRDGRRASDVITRLRALFSKKELAPESLDLNEATREVIALSWSDLQRNRVILRSELLADLPPVTGDRVQLQHSFSICCEMRRTP